MKRVALLAFFLLALTLTSQASIIVSLTGVTPNGSNWDWSYSAILQPDQNIRNGDFFTIYDFFGLLGGTWTPNVGTNWSIGSSALGVTPPLTAPPDSGLLPNVTVTLLTGGPILGAGGGIDLGTLVITSTSNLPVVSAYAAQAQKQSDLSQGVNVGFVNVPTGVNTVPEPTTVAMFGAGLAALGLIRRRRA